MTYNLAQWLSQKNLGLWNWILRRNILVLLLLFIPVIYISMMIFLLSLIFYAASIMVIFEKIAMSMFIYFKRKIKEASFFGKIIYLPFFLISILFCGIVLVLSLGNAFNTNST